MFRNKRIFNGHILVLKLRQPNELYKAMQRNLKKWFSIFLQLAMEPLNVQQNFQLSSSKKRVSDTALLILEMKIYVLKM